MLQSYKKILGSTIHALDGKIGHVDDLLFDDVKWVVRYIVVKTGGFLSRKRVLISPLGIAKFDWEKQELTLNLTCKQVELSPDVDTDQPVFRQMEERYFNYYGWPYYWTDLGTWGIDPLYPFHNGKVFGNAKNNIPNLRSCRAVSEYAVLAEDTRMGEVQDYLLEDGLFTIRYLVVSARAMFHKEPILIAPEWICSIRWVDEKICVNLAKDKIESSPNFGLNLPIDKQYEKKLYQHYRRPNYWEDKNNSVRFRKRAIERWETDGGLVNKR